ncbi:zinc finger, C3HC4 type, domain containing protein [Musa troglodytarum]|uniref:E3 ubiquitin-protein ligase RMA n=1 Tax=Musa troglodytarum TaxID=320322 RepID=A0A9E7EBS3_9LILI|nr:zinc finger, C3HC4 type, domain containing protein [Musa troglodytarum]
MDLNLYLGLPRSPRSLGVDLGSDLALSSLPLLSSSFPSVQDSQAPTPMSGVVEPSDSHPPYSPSHAEYIPDLPAVLLADIVDNREYTPYLPAYERYGPSFLPVLPEPDTPYSPPGVLPLPAVEEPDETAVPNVDSHMPHGAASFSFYPAITTETGEFLCPEDGSSSRPEPLRSPESRFRRLIESSHRWPNRRFRSSLPPAGERFRFGSPSLPNPEQSVHDVLDSQRPPECNGKHKVIAEDNAAETSGEEMEEKGRSASNFECNICFDMAAEPVVTSCGHLFCWPCLYQWLHVHSDHKECPVCKGEVTESNITPIYGRGISQPNVKKKIEENGESTLRIPPRPCGNRFESFRQQLRPVSRRLGEGLAATWRRIIDQHMRSGNTFDAYADPSLQEIFDNVHRRALSRLRERRVPRGVNRESGSITGEVRMPENNLRNNANSIFQDGVDLWPRFSILSVMANSINRVVGRLSSNTNGFDASTPSVDPPNLEPLVTGPRVEAPLTVDRSSVSSTMAVIQGDVASSDALAGPNSVGSSRSIRRRGRSSTSGSFDVDGGPLLSRKRRRLN